MDVGDKMELVTVCYTDSQISMNRTYWNVDTKAGTGATNAQIAAAFNTALAANYKGFMSAQASWRGVSIRKVTVPTSAPTTNVSSAGVGTVAEDLLPTQSSGVISWVTDFGGPSFRGRIYPGFPPKTFADAGGSMTAAAAVALGLISQAYINGVTAGAGGNTNTFQLMLRRRTAGTYVTVLSAINRQKFATQRRRGQYGRFNGVPF